MMPFRSMPLPRWLEAGDLIRVEEYREDGTLVVRADLPGIDADKDAELTVSDGMLHIVPLTGPGRLGAHRPDGATVGGGRSARCGSAHRRPPPRARQAGHGLRRGVQPPVQPGSDGARAGAASVTATFPGCVSRPGMSSAGPTVTWARRCTPRRCHNRGAGFREGDPPDGAIQAERQACAGKCHANTFGIKAFNAISGPADAINLDHSPW